MSALRKSAAKITITPKLSAPLTAVRRQFLNKVKALTSEEAIITLREDLTHETSELARLGNLAAQSWIVRQRLIALQQQTGTLEAPPEEAAEGEAPPVSAEAESADAPNDAPPEAAAPEPEPVAEGWRKLRINNETEVNGMIFFAGSTIQVQAEDAQKLVESGHAEEFTEAQAPKKPRKKRAKPKPKPAEDGAE